MMKKIMSVAKGYIKATDKWMIILWLCASVISVVFLSGLYACDMLSSFSIVLKQAGVAGIGLLCAVAISFFNYNSFIKLWKIYAPVTIALVVITYFLSTGERSNDAWLGLTLGPVSLTMQPSEFLKISFITTMAVHLNRIRDNMNSLLNVISLCIHAAIHFLLIQQLQNDTGSALVFVFIFFAMVFSAGLSWKYIVAGFAGIAILIPVIWDKFMSLDQRMRFLILQNPELDAAYAYQQTRGKLALGIGGLRGIGTFSGNHVRVPEVYNDFIFTFIGEATGFMGCLGVIVLLGIICCKILYNSSHAIDDTGRYLCVGVFGMFFIQAVINIGMCLGVMPVIGVTLPLISAGGTSVISLYLGLGLILSVYTHSNTGLFYTDTSITKF